MLGLGTRIGGPHARGDSLKESYRVQGQVLGFGRMASVRSVLPTFRGDTAVIVNYSALLYRQCQLVQYSYVMFRGNNPLSHPMQYTLCTPLTLNM